MGLAYKIIRIILQYICGLVFAWGLSFFFRIVGLIVSQWYCKIFLPPPPTLHAYDDFIGGMGLLMGLFGGIPFGASLGVLLGNRLFFKPIAHYIWRIIAGFIMGILGSAFVYLVFPFLDIDTSLLYQYLPFLGINTQGWLSPVSTCPVYSFLSWGGDEAFFLISTLFALIGYNLAGLFGRKAAAQ